MAKQNIWTKAIKPARAAFGAAVLGAALCAAPLTASAVIINPAPALFGPDDGTQLFNATGDFSVSVEMFDLLDAAIFGFYRNGQPFDDANTGIIFELTDTPPPQVAVISFGTGQIFDMDAGVVLQDTFTPGPGAIGFFLSIGGTTMFTDPGLNPLGLDLAATFPGLVDPSLYLIGFEVPTAAAGPVTLTFDMVGSITPISEPLTVAIFGTGLLGLAALRRGRRRKSVRII